MYPLLSFDATGRFLCSPSLAPLLVELIETLHPGRCIEVFKSFRAVCFCAPVLLRCPIHSLTQT